MIKVENIIKKFGYTIAVDDISFEVNKGDILGFLGPNAAGKTTTMRVLTCFFPPNSGTATLSGYDIFKNSIEVRRIVGYLPESAPLYLDMNVVDYLKFIANIRGFKGSELNKRIKKMIDTCSLEKVVGKDIEELSKGYRQRVGLASAMIHDPNILILDEPTSGLDPNQIIEIRKLIKEIGKEKTIILSTHILPEVSATCSRVLIINEGRIVASGTPDELTKKAKGGENIYLGVKGPKDEIKSKIISMEHVTTVEEINHEDKIINFLVKCEAGSDLSENLFFLVRDNNWSLTKLHKEEANLEDVFLQLTTKES
ncbi:MAG: ATP-binding cassette domain-containing protein [bacterium]|nr:ATP-binding cassette domain-containing protein [bacterium]